MASSARFVVNVDVDETEDDVLTAGGYVNGIHAVNNNAAILYLKLYDDVAANVTVGTTEPAAVFGIPAGGGFTREYKKPIHFNSGMCVAAVTGAAVSSTGAPDTNDVVVTFDVSGA